MGSSNEADIVCSIGVGSVGSVPCFACCRAQRGVHQLKPVTYNCLGDPQLSPTDLAGLPYAIHWLMLHLEYRCFRAGNREKTLVVCNNRISHAFAVVDSFM